MKQLFTVLFLVASLTGIAQQQTNGFWEVPFMIDKAAVKRTVETKKHVKPEEESADMLAYGSVSFGGEIADYIILRFYEGRFWNGMVYFIHEDAPLALLRDYYDWKEKLTKKYGEPLVNDEIKPSYFDESLPGIVEHAFKNGDANFTQAWTVTDADNGRATNVMLTIIDETKLMFSIADKELMTLTSEKRKAKASKDF